jgi:CBS domain-containing protein
MTRNLDRKSRFKGAMDERPKKDGSRVAERSGEIMTAASKSIISTHPSNTIKNAAAIMRDSDVRRLPVIHAGSGRLEGMVSAIDILDFLGGGPKYNIIEKDYGGNFLAAVNCPVSKIMQGAQYLEMKASVEDAVAIILERRSSCIPIIDGEKTMNVVGIITERDILPGDDPDGLGVTVGEVMHKKPITASTGMMLSDVSKIMVRNRLRRLPVILEDGLVGVVTVFDVLGYLEEGHYKGIGAEENLSTRVDEIMEKHVVTVAPEEDLGKVLSLVKESGYGGFPVVKDGKVVGVVTITDILRWIYQA